MGSARRTIRFKQADLARAIRAAISAGLSIAKTEIDADGKIVLIYGAPAVAPGAVVDELEEWRKKHARHA